VSRAEIGTRNLSSTEYGRKTNALSYTEVLLRWGFQLQFRVTNLRRDTDFGCMKSFCFSKRTLGANLFPGFFFNILSRLLRGCEAIMRGGVMYGPETDTSDCYRYDRGNKPKPRHLKLIAAGYEVKCKDHHLDFFRPQVEGV
jgi:hypothetical protein